MRKPIEQRIRELEEQKRSLQSRLEKQERARTARRRILLGTFLLERLERHERKRDDSEDSALRDLLQRELPEYLGRDADRDLFADLLSQKNDASLQGVTYGHSDDGAGNERIRTDLSDMGGEQP